MPIAMHIPKSTFLRSQSDTVNNGKDRKKNDRREAKFDEDNGQVYISSALRALCPEDRNWTDLSEIQQAKFEGKIEQDPVRRAWYCNKAMMAARYLVYLKKQRDLGPAKGCRKLVEIAVTIVVRNIDKVEMSILEPLPTKVLIKIWRQITRQCLVNFRTWKAFSKLIVRCINDKTGAVLPCDLATFDLYRYEQCICKPALPLLDYIQPLTSPSFDFISILSISENLPTAQLMQLTQLRNLGALHLMYTKTNEVSRVDDRLMRAWSESVINHDAFPVLRVLNLWGYPDITINSLQYISKFPALGVFDIKQCSFRFGTEKEIKFASQKHNWDPHFLISKSGKHPVSFDLVREVKQKFDSSEQDFTIYCTKRQEWDEHGVIRKSISDETPDEIIDEKTLLSFQELELAQRLKVMYVGRGFDAEWQTRLHYQFTLLGIMRRDSDLESADVKLRIHQGNDGPSVYENFYVSGLHIPPIPIVSLYLGDRDECCVPRLMGAEHCPSDISFTRVNLPTHGTPSRHTSTFGKDARQLGSSGGPMSRDISGESLFIAHSTSNATQERSCERSKKRSKSSKNSEFGLKVRSSKKKRIDFVLKDFSGLKRDS